MKSKTLLILPIIAIIVSFKNNETTTSLSSPQQTKSQNLNISFLLDLSDRISPKKNPSPNMEYYQRDIQYIKSVQKAFVNHVKTKKILQLNDQMQVFFDPTPKSPIINELSQELKVSFDKRSSKESIFEVEKTYSTIPQKIYTSAIKDGKYIGSDIWSFFKNKIQDYCIKNNHRNILVIITDGYIYHKDSKFINGNKSSYITPLFIQSKKLNTVNYRAVIEKNNLGFIPATSDLQNLEIIVLGINPSKGNPFEGDVIKKYWEDWLVTMNVKKFYLKTADLPADLDPILQKIISGK